MVPTLNVPGGRGDGSDTSRGYPTCIAGCRCARLGSKHVRRPGSAHRERLRVDGVHVLGGDLPEPRVGLPDLPPDVPLPHRRPAARDLLGRRGPRHPRAQGAGGPLLAARRRAHAGAGPGDAGAHVGVVRRRRPGAAATCSPRPRPSSGTGFQEWMRSAGEVLDRYFDLEDPRRLEPADRELYVETLTDSKLLLRGLHRPARRRAGRCDPSWWTTRAAGPRTPTTRPRRCSRCSFYALLIWRTRGRGPEDAPAGLPRQRRDPALRARRGRPAAPPSARSRRSGTPSGRPRSSATGSPTCPGPATGARSRHSAPRGAALPRRSAGAPRQTR